MKSPYKIVGSTALYHNLDVPLPEGKDIDIWSPDPSEWEGQRVDVHWMPQEILDLMEPGEYASLDDLYTVKLSHLIYDIHWFKHALVYTRMMQRPGSYHIKPELLGALREHWKGVHPAPNSRLSLNKSRKDFFDDAVDKVYDHDWLHEQVAIGGIPVYTRCLKDGQEVLIDRKKFEALDIHSRIRMFKEEVAVIAIERYMVHPAIAGKYSPTEAWYLALKKTILNLTKGWAQEFILSHLTEMLYPIQEYYGFLGVQDSPHLISCHEGDIEDIIDHPLHTSLIIKQHGKLWRKEVSRVDFRILGPITEVKRQTRQITVFE